MMYAYLVLQLCLLGLALFGYFQVKDFLRAHSAISSPAHLSNFKSLVRINMYGALIYLVLGIPTVLMSMYFGYVYGIFGILVVLAVNIPQLLFSKHLRGLEEQARRLSCSSELDHEFRMVSEAWFKKALPNF
jgi:hypothetical protein